MLSRVSGIIVIRLILKLNDIIGSELSERLRGFLSSHGQRLSRTCADQITECIQSLEEWVEDFQLPDLGLGDGQSYKNLLQWTHPRYSPLWSANRKTPRNGKEPRGPHEQWPFLQAFKHILDMRKCMTDRLHEFLSRWGQRLSRACAGQIAACIPLLEDGFEDFPLPELELSSSGVTLRLRPGSLKPEDPALLDAFEELIYHTVRSGNEKEAYALYSGRLGGREHLGKVIGEFARGARILRYFRAQGARMTSTSRGTCEESAIFARELRPPSRTPIGRSGRGRILCSSGVPAAGRSRLQGRSRSTHGRSRPSSWGGRMPSTLGSTWVGARPWSMRTSPLMRGELAQARAVAASDLKKFKDDFPHVPEQVRTRLVPLAEIERREGQTDELPGRPRTRGRPGYCVQGRSNT